MEHPPSVEGHMPTQEEMERKAASGPHLLNNVDAIVSEFPSAGIYTTPGHLETLVSRNREAIEKLGYQLVDASHLFNGITNGLLLLERWATVVHTARTSKQMIVARRTPENCGALLLLQRLEHLRGQITEWSPIAFAAVVRDDQLLVTRDKVGNCDETNEMLRHMARTEELCKLCNFFLRARVSTVLKCGHVLHSDCYAKHLEDTNTCPVCYQSCGDVKPVEIDITDELKKFQDLNMEKDHNMPTPLFTQEISLLRELRKSDLCNPNAKPKEEKTDADTISAVGDEQEATNEDTGLDAPVVVEIGGKKGEEDEAKKPRADTDAAVEAVSVE